MRQPIVVGGVILALDQRQAITAESIGDVISVLADVFRRERFLLVGNVGCIGMTQRPTVGIVPVPLDGGHDAAPSLFRKCHRFPAAGLGLFGIHRGGQVPPGALAVVKHGAVYLQLEFLFHKILHHLACAAQLDMAERVLAAAFGEEPALPILGAFRDGHRAISMS